ncbi:hypothetical protein P7C70_g6508, partial [Phenoliferia sp. Uapishka_3]
MWGLGSLSKLRGASPGPGKAASSPLKGKGKGSPREDPLTSFVATWEQLKAALSSDLNTKLPFNQSSIPRHLGQLLALLTAEASDTSTGNSQPASEPLGPCQEYLVKTGVLATLVTLSAKDKPVGTRRAVIAWANQAVAALGDGFVVHSAVHRPLVKLIRKSVESEAGLSKNEEEALVDIMCRLSERIRNRPELLAIFFRERAVPDAGQAANLAATVGRGASTRSRTQNDSPSSRSSSPTPSTSTMTSTTSQTSNSATHRKKAEHDFLLFAFLLRFVHREGNIGDLARAGLVFLFDVAVTNGSREDRFSSPTTSVSVSQPEAAREARLALSEYLLDSDFSDVLAAGLGALYGLLPGKLLVRPAGSTPSTGAWNNETLEAGTGGMVLGGMGAHEAEDDPEEAQRKMEEEENRLRALGVALSGTTDFREGLDGWLKLVEFTQEILLKASLSADTSDPSPSTKTNPRLDTDDVAREQALVTSALKSSILASIRSLFLPVLYTSILECSGADGSAVAVLSYLDALLSVVQEGSSLGDAILGFLMGEEDLNDFTHPKRTASDFLSPGTHRARRRKASALVLLEGRTPSDGPGIAATSPYFTSLGRFSLKDLLASTVSSPSAATSSAALKLFQTMLSRHDRWSMGLLDIVLDEGATFFPFALRDSPPEPSPSPTNGNGSESDDDSDVFVYPSETPTKQANLCDSPLVSPFTPRRLPSLILGTPLPPTPSINSHLDSIDALVDLLESIDPSGPGARPSGEGGASIFSKGFSSYVQDAEAALASDAGFRRGVAADPTAPTEAPSSPQARRRSNLFGAAPALSSRDFAASKTAFRHRLDPWTPLVGLVLESLAQFFSHPPDVNLSLTAVLSTLALSPYRSLDGWILPAVTDDKFGFEELAALGRSDKPASESDDGDDRSVDHDVDDLSRHDAFSFSTNSHSNGARRIPARGESVLAILSALSKSVALFRSTVPNFDQYLAERRQGIHFVDNLADALDFNDDGGNAFQAAVRELSVSDGTSSFDASRRQSPLLSPTPSTGKRDVFLTPPRPQVRKEPSTTSIQSTATASAASPFAAHYRQTGSIMLTPAPVSSARSRHAHWTGGDDDELGPPDTPTKRLSPAAREASGSVLSDDSDAFQRSPSQRGTGEPATVTLSTTLDNVLLLEEFVKELTAIVLVRRGTGVDRIRFL